MARPKYTPRAGEGAKAKVLTKMIYPRRYLQDPKHQSVVVLIAEEEMLVNRKQQKCYTFTIDGGEEEDGAMCYAIQRYVHVFEEGDTAKLFNPSLPGPNDQIFQKTKKEAKWRKSKTKKLLYDFLMDGTVPMEEDGSMMIEDIYALEEEFAEFELDKFKAGLSRLRKKIKELESRADKDLEAFRNYKKNHKPALFSHKGYIQWQGSTAQELLWDDLDAYLKDPTQKPKKLWLSRDEYKYFFPLEAFRDKIKQEIRTEKYIQTRRARDNGQNV
jgi:hypothetical protein